MPRSEFYQKYREQTLEYNKAYHVRNCDAINERRREHYAQNREYYVEKGKSWRTDNPEKLKASNKKWKSAHPEALRKNNADRHAKKMSVYVESVDHGVVFERDGYVCGICGQPVADETPWLDHVIPLSAGGEHSYANTQCSHPVCNLKKGAKLDYAVPTMGFAE